MQLSGCVLKGGRAVAGTFFLLAGLFRYDEMRTVKKKARPVGGGGVDGVSALIFMYRKKGCARDEG